MNVSDPIDRSIRSQALLDSRHLATFRAVANELSFTQAGFSLGYVQSSVTTHIQSLERELEVTLFDRLGRTVSLTDAGKRLLDYANRILDLTEEARSVVGGDDRPTGTLTIGAPDTLCAYRLPAVLRAFRAEHPAVRVIFHVVRSRLDAHAAVLDGRADAALVLDEQSEDRRMISETLTAEPLAILVAPDHPLAGRENVHMSDLHGLDTVLTERGCGYRDHFESLLTENGVSSGSTVEFASVEAIKECVKAGMGITVLPRVAVAAELRRGELVDLPWALGELAIDIRLTRHKDKWLSPTLAAFLTCLRDHLAEPELPAANV